jgi:hypothetical protein
VAIREASGAPLAEKQTAQNRIADSNAEMDAARLTTLHAAWKMEQKLDAAWRCPLITFSGARVLQDVIDRAIQAHGAMRAADPAPVPLRRAALLGRIPPADAEIRLLDARLLPQGRRRSRGDHAALLEHVGAIGDVQAPHDVLLDEQLAMCSPACSCGGQPRGATARRAFRKPSRFGSLKTRRTSCTPASKNDCI